MQNSSKIETMTPGTPGSSASGEEAVFRVGTLSYTPQQLYVLFFWLMWNDFSITLIEQIGTLGQFLVRNNGATITQMAVMGSVSSLLTVWLNPICSTWSDRTRTRFGRRRPFVLLATPFFAFFLMLTPYMPGFYHYVVRYHWAASILSYSPIKGELLFIFVCGLIAGVFNAMVLAIFSYLYWDVVPSNVLGRFNALGKIVTILAGFVWYAFFFGLGEHHMKGVFVGVSLFCLVFYMISTWQVKEGEYPPVDPHVKGGFFAPIRAYCVECFSKPYFLWIFLGFTLYQVNNQGNQGRVFYCHYTLGLSLDTLGKFTAVASALSLVATFFFGIATDKFNPVRLLAPAYLLWGAIYFASYFIVKGPVTALISTVASVLASTFAGIITAAITPRIYPTEKLGQYCSASALSQQVTCALIGPLLGELLDHTSTRFAYLWSADFLFAAAVVFYRVYLNWQKRHGHAPHPHAG
jgi:Na+/melibiose symporter-like transporter